MERQKLYELTHRKLTGQITGAELLYFEELSKEEDNKKLIEEIEAVWNKTGEIEDLVFDKKAAFQKFLESTDQARTVSIDNRPKARVFTLWKITSVIAAIFLLSLFVIKQFEADILTHSYDEGAIITLADNSRITLGEGSQINYPENFSRNRSVELEGKAVFEVAKGLGSEFSVIAGKTKITVLGTTFLVETDDSDHSQNIEVIEGKVKVDNRVNQLVIQDREGVHINSAGAFSKRDNISFSEKTFYKPEMVYNNTPLTKVLADIEVTYDIEFTILSKADFSNCKFTSRDLSDIPLEEVITILQTTFDAEFIKKDDHKYEIKRLACR